jgi:hypothetical protein
MRLPPVGERKGSGKWRVIPAVYRALVARRGEIDAICCIDYRGIGLAALAANAGRTCDFSGADGGCASGARVRGWMSKFGAKPGGPMMRVATWPIRALRTCDAIGCIRARLNRKLWPQVCHGTACTICPILSTPRASPATADERRAIRRELQIQRSRRRGLRTPQSGKGRDGAGAGVGSRAAAARLVLIGPAMPEHAWDVSERARDFVATTALTTS